LKNQLLRPNSSQTIVVIKPIPKQNQLRIGDPWPNSETENLTKMSNFIFSLNKKQVFWTVCVLFTKIPFEARNRNIGSFKMTEKSLAVFII